MCVCMCSSVDCALSVSVVRLSLLTRLVSVCVITGVRMRCVYDRLVGADIVVCTAGVACILCMLSQDLQTVNLQVQLA